LERKGGGKESETSEGARGLSPDTQKSRRVMETGLGELSENRRRIDEEDKGEGEYKLRGREKRRCDTLY
jgi:hypothetical protein